MTTDDTLRRVPGFTTVLLLLVLAVLAWSGWQPRDRPTWWMEIAPVLIGLAVLVPTYRRFPLTDLAYALLAFHAVVLLVGGKYTYAEMPLFNWLRDTFGHSRNHYDRLAHFVQGFVPAIVARELLLRTSPLRPGKWLFALVCASCLAISALYELIEWQAAVHLEDGATAFIGGQGDPWDTQTDMALALLGAITAQLVWSRHHDHRLESLRVRPPRRTPVM